MGTEIDEYTEPQPQRWPKTCKNCRHFCAYIYEFDADEPDDWVESDYGECRRFPPKNVPEEERRFPVVEDSCWCGEFDI